MLYCRPMRRAKIVCTLGPATSSAEQVTALVESGMDVARLNFSHGAHADHATAYERVRAASDRTGHAVAVLADLQGPKIRLGTFADGPVHWETGSRVCITVDDVPGTAERVATTYKGLAADVRVGDRLLVDDGKLALSVVGVDGPDVWCLVVEGGEVSNNKGLSLPGVAVSVPALSDKDEEDLRFALHLGADFVALSFVRRPEDVELVREIMRQEDIEVPVIAKLEKPEAVERLEEIVDAFDGIMVARGDLGVELPLEEVPLVQKRAIEAARDRNKPVIVATQMLESMITNSRPTRAEASDVANAVLDGADAVMLSGETSVGEYPVVTVQTMARIVASTEDHGLERIPPLGTKPRTQGGAITLAAAEVADFVDARYVCVFTESGDSARRMSRLRFRIPMKAFTPDAAIQRRMALTWGIESFLVDRVTHTDAMYKQVDEKLLAAGLAEAGDKVVVISGSPPGSPGSTNDLRVHTIGDAINAVAPVWDSGEHAD